MNALRLRAGLWCALMLVVAAAGLSRLSGGFPLQTNLLTLLPATERSATAEQAVTRLSEALGDRVLFLVGHADPASATQAAAAFADALRGTASLRKVVAQVPPFDPELLLGFYRPFRFGLLSEADRRSLLHGSSDEPGLRLQRKLLAPFRVGAAYSLADDPFGYSDAWIAGLPFAASRLAPEDGFLVAHDDGKTWVLVSAELGASAYDNALQTAAVDAADRAEAEARQGFAGLSLLRTGTVFYADAARRSAERDVDAIGAGSLLGMLALLFWVFRSVRPLALGLVSVGAGIATAVVVTVCVHGELHLITMVFGASLIGEAIDYAIQYFAARTGGDAAWEPLSGLRRIAPGLRMALATSLLGYAALMLAPFPALSQIALFAIAGLSAAWLTVFLLLPFFLRTSWGPGAIGAGGHPGRLFAAWLAGGGARKRYLLTGGLLLFFIPGCLLVQGNDDVRLLIARSPELARQEARIRELTGIGGDSWFFLVEADTPEQMLQREETLTDRLSPLVARGELSGFTALSSFVPSQQRQMQNARLWQQRILGDARELGRLLASYSFDAAVVARYQRETRAAGVALLSLPQWLQSPLSIPYRFLLLGDGSKSPAASIVLVRGADPQSLAQVAQALPGVSFIDKAGSVSRLFGEYRRWGAFWLGGALALVFGLLWLRYGLRGGLWTLAPTVVALVTAVGIAGYAQLPFTLFNLMALMLVLGVGVNYAIFLREGGALASANQAGVLLSAATTLLSFGLLAFSAMPALSGFGLTMLGGIGAAAALSPIACRVAQDGAE